MINTQMRDYDYFLYGVEDAYGQPTMSDKQGVVKMTINIASESVQENVLYNNAEYVGLSHAPIDDTYVIQYGDKKLKVIYVNPMGKLKQVYMKVMQ